MTLQHMGDLHPFEQLMVVLLAFGPILLLVATVVIARRRDAANQDVGDQHQLAAEESLSGSTALRRADRRATSRRRAARP